MYPIPQSGCRTAPPATESLVLLVYDHTHPLLGNPIPALNLGNNKPFSFLRYIKGIVYINSPLPFLDNVSHFSPFSYICYFLLSTGHCGDTLYTLNYVIFLWSVNMRYRKQ